MTYPVPDAPFADNVRISGLKVRTVIGTREEERTKKQPVIFDAVLYGDFRLAARTDDFTHTFDYSAAEKLIVATAEKSSFFLLEALAERVAQSLLRMDCHVKAVALTVSKPAAAEKAENISLSIYRGAGAAT